MVKRIIGLAGKSGSGKDVVADYISDRYGYKKIAVADAIRDEVQNFLNESLSHSTAIDLPPSFSVVLSAFREAVWAKPTAPEIRVLLQFWGTELRRSEDSLYWVKKLADRLGTAECIVVSDIRTPDELRTIRDAGGEVWFVERPGVDSVGIAGHFTEVALEGSAFDRTIHNISTLAELISTVDWIFHEC